MAQFKTREEAESFIRDFIADAQAWQKENGEQIAPQETVEKAVKQYIEAKFPTQNAANTSKKD